MKRAAVHPSSGRKAAMSWANPSQVRMHVFRCESTPSALLQRGERGFTISVNHEALNMSFSPSGTAVEADAASARPTDALVSSIETGRADSFVQLGSAFVTRLPATPLPEPYLVGISADTYA